MKREQRGESREKRDYNLLSNWLRFFTELLPPLSSLFLLHGMTKKGVIARQRSCRGNLILTTTEKPSLRTTENCVAIPLFAIRRCLYEIPHRFALRNNNFVVGL